MDRQRVLGNWVTALAVLVSEIGIAVHPQTPPGGERVRGKLLRAGLIDAYPEVALEVGESLRRAAPDQWAGVQVNGPYRAGWLNIYRVDAGRLRDDALLHAEGVNLTPETLRAGALARPKTSSSTR